MSGVLSLLSASLRRAVAALVTTFPQLTSHTNATQTGTGPYSYAATGDAQLGVSDIGGILLSENGRYEVTVSGNTGYSAFTGQLLNVAQDIDQDTYGIVSNTSNYNTIIDGAGNAGTNRQSSLNLGDDFTPALTDVKILEFIGTKVLFKLRPTGVSREYVIHSFARARGETIYPGMRFFGSPSALTNLKRIIGSRLASLPANGYNFVFAGNSFFAGDGGTGIVSQFFDDYPVAGNGTTFTNVAVNGETWNDIQANQAGPVAAAHVAGKQNCLVVIGSSNSIFLQGRNQAQTILDAKAAIPALKTGKTWVKTIILTEPPRCQPSSNQSDMTAKNVALAGVNADMLANPSLYGADLVIDCRGGVGNPLGTISTSYLQAEMDAIAAYYQEGAGAQIHPNDAGWWWVKQQLQAGVLSLGAF